MGILPTTPTGRGPSAPAQAPAPEEAAARAAPLPVQARGGPEADRKSTRLNSSHQI